MAQIYLLFIMHLFDPPEAYGAFVDGAAAQAALADCTAQLLPQSQKEGLRRLGAWGVFDEPLCRLWVCNLGRVGQCAELEQPPDLQPPFWQGVVAVDSDAVPAIGPGHVLLPGPRRAIARHLKTRL